MLVMVRYVAVIRRTAWKTEYLLVRIGLVLEAAIFVARLAFYGSGAGSG